MLSNPVLNSSNQFAKPNVKFYIRMLTSDSIVPFPVNNEAWVGLINPNRITCGSNGVTCFGKLFWSDGTAHTAEGMAPGEFKFGGGHYSSR